MIFSHWQSTKNIFPPCRLSSSSQRGSSSSGLGVSGSEYEGVGTVGYTDDDDVQSVVAPFSASSSRYSSANAYEAEDLQQRVIPADLSSVSSNAYRSSQTEHDEDDLQRSVGSGYGGTASRVYSQRAGNSASESSRVGAAAVPVYVSGSQLSHSSQTEAELNESRKPQYVSISARPGQATVLAVPVRVIHTQGVPDDNGNYYTRTAEHRASEQASSSSRVHTPTSTTYRVTYNPSRNFVASDKIASSNSESENFRSVGSVQQPEKFVGYNTFNVPESSSQTRFRADERDSHAEQSQVRVAPVSVSYPSNGGSSRFASTGSSSAYNQARVVPVFPVNTIESTSSLRTAEEKEQRRYTPSSPTYVSASRLSADQEERNQQASTQYGSSGTIYAPVTTQTRLHSGSGAQTQYQRQGYGGTFSPYVSSANKLSSSSAASSDQHSSQRFGLGSASTDDLNVYISESERLARLQQHQIAGSSSNVAASSNTDASSHYDANRRTLQAASNLDSAAANFVRSSNLASRNSEFDTASVDGAGTGAGGFNRVRSWNKQSKWSSGLCRV